jgi:ferredoxin-NADP reductase
VPRLVTIDIEEIVELRGALPLRWSAPEEFVRSLRVVDRRRETDDVTSFVLASRDGGPLPTFRAGQHLPIEIRVPGFDQPLNRTYSLSNGPDADCYRISVKREPQGVVSRYLHDSLETDDVLNAAGPAGDFHLLPGDRPVVLISAGIGVTPMMSMLHQLAGETPRRPVWFVHGARSGRHHAFAAEARFLAEGRDNIKMHVAYSKPDRRDVPGRDYDSCGRVNADLVEKLLPGLDGDFYLCGPGAFLAYFVDELERRGVPAARIHVEVFST